jgi:hypothetical protein
LTRKENGTGGVGEENSKIKREGNREREREREREGEAHIERVNLLATEMTRRAAA